MYNMIPPPFEKPWIKKFPIGKLPSILVSETIKTSMSPHLTCSGRYSNLFLIELMFKYVKTNMFKFLQRKDSYTLLQSATFWSTFVLSELHSSAIKPTFFSLCSQLKILENSLIKVLLRILEPLSFKWSLPLFKCCALSLLVLSIT